MSVSPGPRPAAVAIPAAFAAFAAVAALGTAPSKAAPALATPTVLSGADYLHRQGALLGSPVQIRHCHLEFAEVVPAFCSVYGPAGFADRIGHIVVDTAAMARGGRAAGSVPCGSANQDPGCWVDLAGVPAEKFSGGTVEIWLEDPAIVPDRPCPLHP